MEGQKQRAGRNLDLVALGVIVLAVGAVSLVGEAVRVPFRLMREDLIADQVRPHVRQIHEEALVARREIENSLRREGVELRREAERTGTQMRSDAHRMREDALRIRDEVRQGHAEAGHSVREHARQLREELRRLRSELRENWRGAFRRGGTGRFD